MLKEKMCQEVGGEKEIFARLTMSVLYTTCSLVSLCFPSSFDTLKVHASVVAAQLFSFAKRYVSYKDCAKPVELRLRTIVARKVFGASQFRKSTSPLSRGLTDIMRALLEMQRITRQTVSNCT
eukprot:COSAG02_NODE_3658_length_6408_cov_19.754636_6_plen_123_part_00